MTMTIKNAPFDNKSFPAVFFPFFVRPRPVLTNDVYHVIRWDRNHHLHYYYHHHHHHTTRPLLSPLPPSPPPPLLSSPSPFPGGPRVHDGGQHEGPHVLLRGGRLQHSGNEFPKNPGNSTAPYSCQPTMAGLESSLLN